MRILSMFGLTSVLFRIQRGSVEEDVNPGVEVAIVPNFPEITVSSCQTS